MADDKTAKLPKRFYKTVSVGGEAPQFRVLLDGRPVKTPGRADLSVETNGLAAAVASEWAVQGERIDPHSMPLTQIACTAIDRVAPNRNEIEETVAKYAETDLICYWAQGPDDLVRRQAHTWQPVIDWLSEAFGIRLRATADIMPADQDPEALDAVARIVKPLDDHEMAVLAVMTHAMGSVALGLAVLNGRLDAKDAVAASQLDETYQSELWGLDAEAEQRLKGLRTDVEAASRYLALHRA